MKVVLALLALGAALALHPLYAHGFGERTELPAPLGLFLIGAGATVALSFAVIGLFVRGGAGTGSYWRYNLLQHGWFRVAATTPLLSLPVKALGCKRRHRTSPPPSSGLSGGSAWLTSSP